MVPHFSPVPATARFSNLVVSLFAFQLLTFKEISWQMIRIEADAIQSAEHDMLSAPIRLITNQSKIRVTLKRGVSRTPRPLFGAFVGGALS